LYKVLKIGRILLFLCWHGPTILRYCFWLRIAYSFSISVYVVVYSANLYLCDYNWYCDPDSLFIYIGDYLLDPWVPDFTFWGVPNLSEFTTLDSEDDSLLLADRENNSGSNWRKRAREYDPSDFNNHNPKRPRMDIDYILNPPDDHSRESNQDGTAGNSRQPNNGNNVTSTVASNSTDPHPANRSPSPVGSSSRVEDTANRSPSPIPAEFNSWPNYQPIASGPVGMPRVNSEIFAENSTNPTPVSQNNPTPVSQGNLTSSSIYANNPNSIWSRMGFTSDTRVFSTPTGSSSVNPGVTSDNSSVASSSRILDPAMASSSDNPRDTGSITPRPAGSTTLRPTDLHSNKESPNLFWFEGSRPQNGMPNNAKIIMNLNDPTGESLRGISVRGDFHKFRFQGQEWIGYFTGVEALKNPANVIIRSNLLAEITPEMRQQALQNIEQEWMDKVKSEGKKILSNYKEIAPSSQAVAYGDKKGLYPSPHWFIINKYPHPGHIGKW